MKAGYKKLPLLLLLMLVAGMLLLFFWPESKPDNADHLIGQTIEGLQLVDLNGTPANYSPTKNKITVLNLWATWCPPCREEMPSLQRLSDALDDEQYQVVGIAMEQDDHLVREFLRERSVFFLNLLDVTDSVISEKLLIKGLPSTLILNEQGVVVAVVLGSREWDSLESRNLIEKAALSN